MRSQRYSNRQVPYSPPIQSYIQSQGLSHSLRYSRGIHRTQSPHTQIHRVHNNNDRLVLGNNNG